MLGQSLDESNLGAVKSVRVLFHGGPLQNFPEEWSSNDVGQPVPRAASALVTASPEAIAVKRFTFRRLLLTLGGVGKAVWAFVTPALGALEHEINQDIINEPGLCLG